MTDVALLPVNLGEIHPLPELRRAQFLAHLAGELAVAEQEQQEGPVVVSETPAPTQGITDEDAQLPILAAGCGYCGGQCCETGGNKAWLEAATFHRVLRDCPQLELHDLKELYLSHLPDETYEASCVYHTTGGCALPRALRSNVCNQFKCRGLAGLLRIWNNSPGPFLVATAVGAKLEEIWLVDSPPPK